MKAAFIEAPGPPENLVYGDFADPTLGPGQCLVRVEAAAVNPIDTYIRSGAVAMPVPWPFIPGCDFAGEVVALGPGVTRVKVGDPVWGSNQGLLGRQGSLAEWVAVDEGWVYRRPDGVSSESAAALALVGITAHLGLFSHAALQSGETVFVRGGSGGVGSMVVQMARLTGARVVTTAGSEEKAELCRSYGADAVILYREEDLASKLAELVPGGVDLWWETLREPDFDLVVGALARRGRMVLMAGRTARPPFPVGPFYVKGCSLHGFAMFNATADEQAACAADINNWLLTGGLRAPIDRILPLEQAAEAHRLQESSTLGATGDLKGKIVLRP